MSSHRQGQIFMCWVLCVVLGVHCEWDKQGLCPGGAKWTLSGYLLSEVVLMANGASDPNWGVTVRDSPFQYSRLTGGTWISLIKPAPHPWGPVWGGNTFSGHSWRGLGSCGSSAEEFRLFTGQTRQPGRVRDLPKVRWQAGAQPLGPPCVSLHHWLEPVPGACSSPPPGKTASLSTAPLRDPRKSRHRTWTCWLRAEFPMQHGWGQAGTWNEEFKAGRASQGICLHTFPSGA